MKVQIHDRTLVHIEVETIEPPKYNIEDPDEYYNYVYGIFDRGSKELIDALKDRWCIAFLERLRDECQRRIDENADKVSEMKTKMNCKINT